MRRLKDPSVGVPDGFRYTHSETGFTNHHVQYWGLLDDVHAHRKANNLTPKTEGEIQDQICGGIPPEWCLYEKGDAPSVSTRLTIRDVVDFTKVLLAHAQSGEYVPQEEAERRAKICVSCYYNVDVAGCGACAAFASLVAGNRTTKYDRQLKSCAVCHCRNAATVHLPLRTLEASDTTEKQSLYPKEFCWRQKLSPNYQPE